MTKTEEVYQFDEEFRNSIATVDEKGKRIWLFPKKPSGYYHRLRVWVSWFLLTLLFAGPFLKINGQPFLLLNIFERKFVVLGQAFWPQDFFILALTLITFFVFVILFTVVFGRIWCGWMCPQTLFMEMIFRKIEYWIEGDAPAQRRLHTAPWTTSKVFKKTTKHILFIAVSLLISHTVMAYLIGIEKTWNIIQSPPSENIAGFIGLMVFTIIFYAVYARFREQACIAVCPYGRLQGVLLSKDSIVVAYDWLRGEPRGRISKQETTSTKGDCIDCKLCVHVCPTGIDIRHGTQLECINCTACMDACDDVMHKIGKPEGLIRYDSHNGIQNQTKKIFNLRVLAYCLVLAALVGVLIFVLTTRSSVEATALKVPGTLYQRTDDGYITNLYNIEFINKTFSDVSLEAKVISPEGATLERVDQKTIDVPAEGFMKGVFFIKIPEQKLPSARTIMTVGIYQDGKLIDKLSIKLIGPVSKSTDMKSRLEDQRNQTN